MIYGSPAVQTEVVRPARLLKSNVQDECGLVIRTTASPAIRTCVRLIIKATVVRENRTLTVKSIFLAYITAKRFNYEAVTPKR